MLTLKRITRSKRHASPSITTNKDGYREYKSLVSDCVSCEQKAQCTIVKQKLVRIHVWQDYLDAVEHIRHIDYGKAVYAKRSETI